MKGISGLLQGTDGFIWSRLHTGKVKTMSGIKYSHMGDMNNHPFELK